MSGGVGPTATAIALPEDDAATAASSLPSHNPRRRFLSFRHLNALAVAVVLSFSGMVALEDAAFALFSLAYLYFLSSVAFPPRSAASSVEPPIFSGPRSLLLSAYVAVAALVGLLLPIAYILHGVIEGDKEGIKAAAPHVFLLASQVFMEGVTFTRQFSLPMRVFVPVFYNGRRMFTIADWLRNEIAKAEELEHGSATRVRVGRGLAVINLVFWGFNLFGFLLPVYCPRAFERHYQYQYQAKLKK